jgi:hypothetical protein
MTKIGRSSATLTLTPGFFSTPSASRASIRRRQSSMVVLATMIAPTIGIWMLPTPSIEKSPESSGWPNTVIVIRSPEAKR